MLFNAKNATPISSIAPINGILLGIISVGNVIYAIADDNINLVFIGTLLSFNNLYIKDIISGKRNIYSLNFLVFSGNLFDNNSLPNE